jgi:hypothetical protein
MVFDTVCICQPLVVSYMAFVVPFHYLQRITIFDAFGLQI